MTNKIHNHITKLNDADSARFTGTEVPGKPDGPDGQFNRREAILRASGYAAFTAASMMAVLAPRKVVASSGYSTPAEAPAGNSSPGNRPSQPSDY